MVTDYTFNQEKNVDIVQNRTKTDGKEHQRAWWCNKHGISHIIRCQLFSFIPVTAIAYYSHPYLPQDLAQGTESINGWICSGMVAGWWNTASLNKRSSCVPRCWLCCGVGQMLILGSCSQHPQRILKGFFRCILFHLFISGWWGPRFPFWRQSFVCFCRNDTLGIIKCRCKRNLSVALEM